MENEMKSRIGVPPSIVRTIMTAMLVSSLLAGCGMADFSDGQSSEQTGQQGPESSNDQYRRVLEQSLVANAAGDLEVLVREHVYPPGWQAPTHYHDGDVFIYVAEGEFEATPVGGGRVVYTSGQAMQMSALSSFDARNVSDTAPLKLVVFQVGRPGDPFLVVVE